MAETDSVVAFKRGDTIRNVNPASQHYGKSGLFQRTHDRWTFAAGLACDVIVDGESVLMSVSDLVREDDMCQIMKNEALWLQKVSHLPIAVLAKKVGVSRQAYYKWLRGEEIAMENRIRLQSLIAAFSEVTA